MPENVARVTRSAADVSSVRFTPGVDAAAAGAPPALMTGSGLALIGSLPVFDWCSLPVFDWGSLQSAVLRLIARVGS